MNYRKIYQQLCEKGVTRIKEPGMFYEKHHIKPRSFGGNSNKSNLTLLTLKEHYIAHLLLVAIYPSSPAMQTALWNMCNITPNNNIGYKRYKPCSKMYEFIRTGYIRVCSGENTPMYGKRHTAETIEKISKSTIGMQRRLGAVLTQNTKDKIGNANRGKILSISTRNQISKSMRGGKCYKAQKIVSLMDNEEFGSGRELSEYLGKPFSTIRRWLNGTTPPPKWFHYRRIDQLKVAYDQGAQYTNTKE